jgi:hypothetical protein
MSLQNELTTIEPKINITDRVDDLICYHFDSVTIETDASIKEYRGIIKNSEDKIICKTFSFTPEFASNDSENINKYVIPFIQNPNVICLPAYEGCLVRLFNYKDKWYVSTHKKIDAFTSKWGSDRTFGDLFLDAHRHSEEYKECLSYTNEEMFKYFDRIYDKDTVYVFILKNCLENRIVCCASEQPQFEPILKIKGGSKSFQTEYEENYTKDFTDEKLNDLMCKVDITKTQGYVFINKETLQSIKIIRDDYIFYAMIRNNQPNILYRFIEIQQSGDEKNVSYLYQLYPERKEYFEHFMHTIDDICINIYRRYRNRFVRKQVSIAPQEQYYIMKELHDNFIKSEKIDIVTQEKVTKYVYSLPPAKLLNLYTAYVTRKEITGNGNRVTQDDKEKIVSCIYKEDSL